MGCPPVLAAPPAGPHGAVAIDVIIEHGLHILNDFKLGGAYLAITPHPRLAAP